jgi:exodeoxyribonuclease-3
VKRFRVNTATETLPEGLQPPYKDWKVSNRGRRLDHVWVTPALKPNLKEYKVLPDARDWVQPSDHVPVVVEI